MGIHLLNQLLNTNKLIYVFVRGDNKDIAVQRLVELYSFYFSKNINNLINKQILIVNGDLTIKNLGISDENYKNLINNIDTVIHSAALVKHYGEYDEFYLSNVVATTNLLNFTKHTKLKDFHYISTKSVCEDGYVKGKNHQIYSELDIPRNLIISNNYVKTKLLGEKKVFEAVKKYNINANIYRIGNVPFNSKGKFQKNLEDNAFHNNIKAISLLEYTPESIFNEIEVSLADDVANKIITIFDKADINNRILHLFNPNKIALNDIIKKPIKIVKINEFLEKINKYNNKVPSCIERFMLDQGFLSNCNKNNTTHFYILQEQTNYILQNLNNSWSKINNNILNKINI